MIAKTMKSGIYLLAFSVVFSTLVSAKPAKAGELENLRQTSKAFSTVAKKAVPAVVFIKVEKTIETGSMSAPGGQYEFNDPFGFFGDEFFERFFQYREQNRPREYRQMGQGSGFIISEDGYIITNNHVVGDADIITVKLHDGQEFNAKIIGGDEKSDVALIKIDKTNLPTMALGDSDSLEIGEWVIAIGNPFGLTETLTFGIVSAKGRSTVGIADYEDFIQTDAAINPGNSGGPLINLNGEAIGINTAIFSGSGGNVGIGFAIPINMAKNIKDQLLKEGKVTRGQLGVIIGEVTKDIADYFKLDSTKGVMVSEVLKGSAAEKAGLQVGDIILKVNGRDVEGIGQLRNTIAMVAPGTKVTLLIYRNGKEKTVNVDVGELSDTSAMGDSSELSEKLGLIVQNLTEDTSRMYGLQPREGVIVSAVASNSPAFRAGISPGTIILSVNQRKVGSIEEYNDALKASMETKKALLLIREQRYTRFVVLTLD